MPITERQREERGKRLYSSDVAAVLGVDPWKSSYDVWLEKTGKVDEIAKPNDAMIAGNALENGILDYFANDLGPMIKNQHRVYAGLPLGAHIDAIVRETNEPVDAKTAGLFGPLDEAWGDALTDQVPTHIVVQAHVHMLCMGGEVTPCHIAAFLGGRGFALFRVERSEQLANIICDRATTFWEKNVLKDIPPDALPTLDVVKRLRRKPDTVASVPSRLVGDWRAARDVRLYIEKREKEALANLLAAMGDAEAGDGGKEGVVTYLEQTRAEYVVKESTFRVARWKKGEK